MSMLRGCGSVKFLTNGSSQLRSELKEIIVRGVQTTAPRTMKIDSWTEKLLSRRKMLGASASTLLSLGLWPGALRAEGKADPVKFNFLVVNDIHYINAKCATFLGRVLQKVKEGASPEFCLLAG